MRTLFWSQTVNIFNSLCSTGIGLDKPNNNWILDTTQFDNILKKLKVVSAIYW